MACTRDDNTLATFAAKNESGLEDAHNGEASGMPEYFSWNCSFRHLPKLANDFSAVVNRVLFSSANIHQRETQYRENKD